MLIVTISHLVLYFILNLTDVCSEISFSEDSCRNQSIDLLCESFDSLLYAAGFCWGCFQHQNRIIEEFKCFFLYLYRTQKQPSRGVSRKRCVLGKGVSTLLKLHFGMDVLLYICCIFSEHLFVRTPLKGCFLEYIFKSKFLN